MPAKAPDRGVPVRAAVCRASSLERVGRSATHQKALRSTLRTSDDRYPYPRINSYDLATRMPVPLCEPNRLASGTLVLARQRAELLIQKFDLLIEGSQHRQQRRDLGLELLSQPQTLHPLPETPAAARRPRTPSRLKIACDSVTNRARDRTRLSRTVCSARTWHCSSEVRCAGRYAPSLHASASARASRLSVFMISNGPIPCSSRSP